MNLPIHIALVPYDVEIPAQEITKVAAALSKQVERDFGPIWNRYATVDAFVRLEDVPIDYWPIIAMRNVEGAAGYHEDNDGQPFAVIEFEKENWSLTASHELLEMIADPFGRRMRAGNLPDQVISLGIQPARVKYLVEVCDPCEAEEFSYTINGILVSDFYTPHFFDPVSAAGVRYSFSGAIDAPRKVLDGGYLSWHDVNSNDWFQLRMFPDEFSNKVPHVINLSEKTVFEKIRSTTNLRSAVDHVTHPQKFKKAKPESEKMKTARIYESTFLEEQEVRASNLKNQISKMVSEAVESKNS